MDSPQPQEISSTPITPEAIQKEIDQLFGLAYYFCWVKQCNLGTMSFDGPMPQGIIEPDNFYGDPKWSTFDDLPEDFMDLSTQEQLQFRNNRLDLKVCRLCSEVKRLRKSVV